MFGSGEKLVGIRRIKVNRTIIASVVARIIHARCTRGFERIGEHGGRDFYKEYRQVEWKEFPVLEISSDHSVVSLRHLRCRDRKKNKAGGLGNRGREELD